MSANMEMVFVSADPEYIKSVNETFDIDTVIRALAAYKEARDIEATEAKKRRAAAAKKKKYRRYLARKEQARQNIIKYIKGATLAAMLGLCACVLLMMVF